jgi:formylglycine-generating enzyme required for sulfatase activity
MELKSSWDGELVQVPDWEQETLNVYPISYTNGNVSAALCNQWRNWPKVRELPTKAEWELACQRYSNSISPGDY